MDVKAIKILQHSHLGGTYQKVVHFKKVVPSIRELLGKKKRKQHERYCRDFSILSLAVFILNEEHKINQR